MTVFTKPLIGRAMAAKLVVIAAVLGLSACANQPVNRTSNAALPTVSMVDLERYQGRWYEIARLPNRFEKNCEGVTADYTLKEDGGISVINTCRKGATDGPANAAKGRARIVDTATNAKLKVSFFGPFWGDYWILDLAPDYSLALIGEPSGRYLWILSRRPIIPEAVKQDALAKLKSYGYDINALYFTKQPPKD